MALLHTLLASLGLLTCLALAVHMMLGARQRRALERWPLASWRWLQRYLLWRFNTRERRRLAREEALGAIQRAKRAANDAGLWEGNVYRPKKFEQPKKPH